jgi:hypothetical protein
MRSGFCQDLQLFPGIVRAQHRLGLEQLIETIRRAVSAFAGGETCADDLTCVAIALDAPEEALPLAHRGTAFDPTTVQPPAFNGSRDGGFGVYIIAHRVDEVRYIRDGQGENSIYLVKKCSP